MDSERNRQTFYGRGRGTLEARDGLSRRDMLKRTAGALAAAAGVPLVGGRGAAQVTGTTPEGGAVPLRLPACALDYLDRKQYIHNMEVHAHISGAPGGSDVWNMWARGAQRILGGGVDVTDPRKPVVMPAQANGCLVYAAHLKKWLVLGSANAPLTHPTPEYPRGQYHEEYAEKTKSYAGLRGIRTYDATDPSKMVLLQEFSTGESGRGTHANFYDGGRYAYLDCGFDDTLRMESTERPWSNALMIVDVWDPANVREVSRWWVPGQRIGEDEEYRKWPFAGDQSSWTSNHGYCVPRRVEDGGDLGYGGWGHFGMYVHDFTDITRPGVWGRVSHPLEAMGGIPYHTVYPVANDPAFPRLRNLLIGVFESLEADCREPWHTSYVIDVADKRHPRIIGLFPRPVPPADAPYPDYCCARGRFSAHNIQSWIAPGNPRPNFVALTYFNAGLRIYDVSDPVAPREVAYFVPPLAGEIDDFESWRRGTGEGIFVEWDRNLIWLHVHEGPKGTRTGLYCLSTPFLGKPVLEPRKVTNWSVPHVNVGWDDQTPRAAYFGRAGVVEA